MDLELSGVNLQEVTNEGWGVTDVKIVPVAAVKKPRAGELETAYKRCLSNVVEEDLPEAFQTRVSGMDDTTAFLEKAVKPMPIDGAAVVRNVAPR